VRGTKNAKQKKNENAKQKITKRETKIEKKRDDP
jgi:hypothetical protein